MVVNLVIMAVKFIVVGVVGWQLWESGKKKKKRETVKRLIAQFIKCYKNIFMIPIFYLSFISIKIADSPIFIVIPIINMLIGIFFCYIKEKCCVSFRFRVKNYFRKFGTTIIDMLLIIVVIGIACLKGPQYGAIVMILKNVFRLCKVYYCFE